MFLPILGVDFQTAEIVLVRCARQIGHYATKFSKILRLLQNSALSETSKQGVNSIVPNPRSWVTILCLSAPIGAAAVASGSHALGFNGAGVWFDRPTDCVWHPNLFVGTTIPVESSHAFLMMLSLLAFASEKLLQVSVHLFIRQPRPLVWGRAMSVQRPAHNVNAHRSSNAGRSG